MKQVLLTGGTIVLRTPEAEALFNELLDQGMLWETISGFFDEYSRGITVEEYRNLTKEIREVRTLMASLSQQLNLVGKSGVEVATASSTPANLQPGAKGPRKPPEVEKPSIDLSNVKAGNISNALGKMSKMRKK